MRWWHHLAVAGALGVVALWVVSVVYDGQLLYYAGPGDPLWLDDILWVANAGSGAALGFGTMRWLVDRT